ncbi:hypothetical protein ACODT3_38420 [Streptomyces sp. 4.24]|uniref:hypothetical protein n=1 Tax=Streptomyces tritrimontium TaxID=3406573 RepID=UPI003BB69193
MSHPADLQGSPGRPLLARPTAASAVGMLMATTPCSVRDAEKILAAAADLADVNVLDVAAAMAAGPGGTPLPALLERALRHAVTAARTPSRAAEARTGVLPSRTRAEEVLSRLRGWRPRPRIPEPCAPWTTRPTPCAS